MTPEEWEKTQRRMEVFAANGEWRDPVSDAEAAAMKSAYDRSLRDGTFELPDGRRVICDTINGKQVPRIVSTEDGL